MPFWVPSLWIAVALAAAPHSLTLALLGYHGICLAGALQAQAWRMGRGTRGLWLLALAPVLLLAVGATLPRLPGFPSGPVTDLLARWPGGLRTQWVYALLVNAPLEEAYWRGALLQRHPTWTPLQAGAAFSLHHGVATALCLPWIWVAPALLGTALVGSLWAWMARRAEGIGPVLLGHVLSDAAILALIQRQLS